MKAKPTLKIVTETIHKVDSYDLEEFIEKVTGYTYEIVASEEWSNDSQHRFTVEAKLDKWNENDWNAFKETGAARSYRLRAILNGLCAEGYIPEGIYLVTVCW